MQSCIGKIAQSIGMDCSNPIVGGYTGRAFIFNADFLNRIEYDPDNENIVISFEAAESPIIVDNAMLSTPLEGSNTSGTNENGTPEFVKVVSGRILTRGADVSQDIVEPLANGRFVMCLEKNDRTLGIWGYELVGTCQPLRCIDPSSIVRNENENEGSISFSLQTTEDKFEINLVLQDEYESTRFWFDEAWDKLNRLSGMSARSLARSHIMSLEDEGESRVVFSTKK